MRCCTKSGAVSDLHGFEQSDIFFFYCVARKKLENECKRVKRDLLELGNMYSSKIEDETFYEKLIMDRDFKGRLVLKIITQNKFEPLMDENDPKAENMMLSIWHGKEATRCDGNINGYSSLNHVLTSKAKKLTGSGGSFFALVSNNYTPNFKVDYSFQYRYRSRAISFYFIKEFLCALAMLIIFQYINYEYLRLFNTEGLTGTEDSKKS